MEDAENAMILLYDLCRLCLDEPGVINIFKPVDWSQDILTYTGIKVTSSNKFPQTICSSCRDIMTCVKLLKDIATENDKRLWLIRGDNDEQVLMTDSHLVFITPCTASCNQDESSDVTEMTSGPIESFKSRIVFESDTTAKVSNSQTEKQSRKKRKSSSKSDSLSSTPKTISVRKDLFDASHSSETVSSSTKKSKEFPKPSSSTEDHDKSEQTPTKKSKQSPTSTSGNETQKIVTAGGIKIKIHEFKHVCETCNNVYATPKKLYFHQLAHNKKFHCPLDACGKKFASKGDLQKHIRSHTGERPYKCNLCDLSFAQNVTLKLHKERKHNEPTTSQS